MEETQADKPAPAGRGGFAGFPGRRKAVSVSQEALVKTSFLAPEDRFPMVIEPNLEGVNLLHWAASQREAVERQLLAHGAILFRGFGVAAIEQFQDFARVFTPALLDYKERAAPRSEVAKSV